ncbi:MAG: hypothetical protein AB9846_16275 [Tenuifilaceae bacterium]
MGLFNFSQNKKTKPSIKDLVWMNQTAKLKGCMNLILQHKDAVIVAWFSDTQDEFSKFLNENHVLDVEIQLARSVSSNQVANKILILLEHYPLLSKETEFISSLNPKQVIVLCSLDESLLNHFAGDRINEMMRRLEMKEDEMIEHPMISKSIERAQQNIEKKVAFENSANSSKEWFAKNVTA